MTLSLFNLHQTIAQSLHAAFSMVQRTVRKGILTVESGDTEGREIFKSLLCLSFNKAQAIVQPPAIRSECVGYS
jgi:hypothetical protein